MDRARRPKEEFADIEVAVYAVINPVIRGYIIKRDGRICQYCNSPVGKNLVVDHVISQSSGGITASCNLVVCCRSCNSKKRKRVWIPTNLDQITKRCPEWKQKIMNLGNQWQAQVAGMRSRELSVSVGVTGEHISFFGTHFPDVPVSTAARILLDWAIDRYQP